MFWAWLLKYSSLLVTGAVSFAVSYALYRLTNTRSDLIYYTSHVQYVTIPPQQGQQQLPPIGTFTLFVWNGGNAPAKDVQIGYYWLPANNVYPNVQRQTVALPGPGGGQVMTFGSIPPKTILSISHLFYNVFTVEQIISYVNWEQGTAKRIPVMLKRIWPKWYQRVLWALLIAGTWVAINATFSLIKFLWMVYYTK
jgi:hypothetical protein